MTIELKYVPLSTCLLWERNPKRHDINAIIKSIKRYGFLDPPKWDKTLNGIIEGNGRIASLTVMEKTGEDVPRGIDVHKETGEWLVPILFGGDLNNLRQAESYAIDHNNLTLAALHPRMVVGVWDDDEYYDILEDLAFNDELPVSLPQSSLDLLMKDAGKTNTDTGGYNSGGGDYSYEIIVICNSGDEQLDLFNRLMEMGLSALIEGDSQ